jgi:hypothetical protein
LHEALNAVACAREEAGAARISTELLVSRCLHQAIQQSAEVLREGAEKAGLVGLHSSAIICCYCRLGWIANINIIGEQTY